MPQLPQHWLALVTVFALMCAAACSDDTGATGEGDEHLVVDQVPFDGRGDSSADLEPDQTTDTTISDTPSPDSVTEDQSSEDQRAEDQSSEDQGAEDQGAEDQSSGDAAVEDQTGDESPDTGSNCPSEQPARLSAVTDSNLTLCYNNRGEEISCPESGERSFGQDAQYEGTRPSFSLVCDESAVLDNNTGLMWERAHHPERVNYATAAAACEDLAIGDFDDWRMPSIRELLSISDWSGSQHTEGAFYIDDDYFDFDYPDLEDDELTGTHSNQMMGQTWSSTPRPDDENTPTTAHYFYNFLDAHIKSASSERAAVELFYRCVRGAEDTLDNEFVDNGDETVTDVANGLMWQKANGQQSETDYQFSWNQALAYCEGLELAEHTDWRLPSVVELQSLVDYDPPSWDSTRMVLDTSVFEFNLPPGKDLSSAPTTSPPDGNSVAPFFWSSTSHGDSLQFAAYVCFGPCWAVETGNFNNDIHGPGAQRADPKDDQGGNLWDRIGDSIGDQADVVQVDDFVRCVRDAD